MITVQRPAVTTGDGLPSQLKERDEAPWSSPWGAQTRPSLQTEASRPSDRIYAPHAAEEAYVLTREGAVALGVDKDAHP